MPEYRYVREDNGEPVDLVMSIPELEQRQDADGYVTLEDGVRARRVYEISGARASWTKPIHSEAARIHTDLLDEYREYDRRRGVPTEYDKRGCPVWRSADHKARYLKAHGLHDKDGGYTETY